MQGEYRGLATFSRDRECSDVELAGIVLLACVCVALLGVHCALGWLKRKANR